MRFSLFALVTTLTLAHAEDPKSLRNPIPYTKKSIAEGRNLYVRYSCTGCHGADGKATVDVVADATDLTNPKVYKSGITEGDLYQSIRDGRGASMPTYKSQVAKPEDLWYLVNFVRSLWPESMRPPLSKE